MTRFNANIMLGRLVAIVAVLAMLPMLAAAQGVDPVSPVDGPGADTARTTDTLRTTRVIDTLRSLDTLRTEEWRAGIYAGVNRNIYSASEMTGLPGVPSCCPGFNDGDGFGVAIGGMVETPVDGALSVGARLYLNTYDGSLVHSEEVLLDREGEAVNGVIEHRIDAEIWSLAIEPILSFGVTEEARLFAGLRGDIIVKKLFSQEERLVEPDDLVFETGTSTRLEYDGTIPDAASFYGTFVAGLRYDVYFDDKEWAFAPEISFYYSPTPVVRGETWNIYGLRLALVGQMIEWDEPEDRAERFGEFIPPPEGPPVSVTEKTLDDAAGAGGAGAAGAASAGEGSDIEEEETEEGRR